MKPCGFTLIRAISELTAVILLRLSLGESGRFIFFFCTENKEKCNPEQGFKIMNNKNKRNPFRLLKLLIVMIYLNFVVS